MVVALHVVELAEVLLLEVVGVLGRPALLAPSHHRYCPRLFLSSGPQYSLPFSLPSLSPGCRSDSFLGRKGQTVKINATIVARTGLGSQPWGENGLPGLVSEQWLL